MRTHSQGWPGEVQHAAIVYQGCWPLTCPHKFLHHDSCPLLKTSMSVHGNQGEFFRLCQEQEIHLPLSSFCSSALQVPTVAAQQALISGDECVGTRALPPSIIRYASKPLDLVGGIAGDSLVPPETWWPARFVSGFVNGKGYVCALGAGLVP